MNLLTNFLNHFPQLTRLERWEAKNGSKSWVESQEQENQEGSTIGYNLVAEQNFDEKWRHNLRFFPAIICAKTFPKPYVNQITQERKQYSMKKIKQISDFPEEMSLNSPHSHLQDHEHMPSNSGVQKYIYVPTSLPQNEEAPIKSRSLKPKVQAQDISFEQGFLTEHQAAFQKEAKNFVEASIKQLEISNQETFTLFRTEEQSAEQELQIKQNQLLSDIQKKQFWKDLETQEKLAQLLLMVSRRTPEQAAKELTYIAMLVWEHYLKVKTLYFTHDNLIKHSKDFTTQNQTKFFDEESRIKFLKLSDVQTQLHKSEQERREAFNKFLQFWVTTVYLAIEEYFENPYANVPSFKRERSEAFSFDFSDSQSFNDSGSFLGGAPTKRMFYFQQ